MSNARQIGVVRYVNFGPFVDSSIDFARPGLTGIDGQILWKFGSSSNGAGKSFLLDGIAWCLWGRCLRADYKGDDVMRITSTSGTFVEVNVVGARESIRVTRYRKHPQNKSRLLVCVAGRDVSRGTDDETQQLVNQLLGMDFAAFQNSVAFGAREDIRSFYSATDSQRKEVFNQILGLSVYAKAEDVAKQHQRSLQSKVQDALARVKGCETVLQTQQALLEQLKLAESSDALDREIESLEASVAQHKKAEVRAKDVFEAADAAFSAVEKRQASARRDFESLQSKHEVQRVVLEKRVREHERASAAAETALDHARSRARQIRQACDSCGQPIPKKVFDEQQVKLGAEIVKHEAALQESNARLSEASDQLRELVKTAPKFVEDVQYAAALKKKSDAKNEANLAHYKHKEVAARLTSAKDRRTRANSQLSVVQSEVEQKKSELQREADKHAQLSQELDQVAFWVEGFGNQGLRSFLIEAEIPEINRRATAYAQKLLGNGATVAFDATTQLKSSAAIREKLSISASIPGCAQNYAGASKGQKRRLDLALLLAFRDVVSNRATNTFRQFFADELFDGLDATGAAHVVELLRDISKDCPVILVTHDQYLRSAVDRMVTVRHDREYCASLVGADAAPTQKPIKKVIRHA